MGITGAKIRSTDTTREPLCDIRRFAGNEPVCVVSRRDASGKLHEIRRFPVWQKILKERDALTDPKVRAEYEKIPAVVDSEFVPPESEAA